MVAQEGRLPCTGQRDSRCRFEQGFAFGATIVRTSLLRGRREGGMGEGREPHALASAGPVGSGLPIFRREQIQLARNFLDRVVRKDRSGSMVPLFHWWS